MLRGTERLGAVWRRFLPPGLRLCLSRAAPPPGPRRRCRRAFPATRGHVAARRALSARGPASPSSPEAAEGARAPGPRPGPGAPCRGPRQGTWRRQVSMAVGASRLPGEFPRGEGGRTGGRGPGPGAGGPGGEGRRETLQSRFGRGLRPRAEPAGLGRSRRSAGLGRSLLPAPAPFSPLSFSPHPSSPPASWRRPGARPGPVLTLGRRSETRVRLPCPPAPPGAGAETKRDGRSDPRPPPCRKLL